MLKNSSQDQSSSQGITPASGRPIQILFVCVGNSCRSQMAEGWANHLGNGKVEAQSAGSHPLGRITPDTYKVMSEKGISLKGHFSKGLDDVAVGEMDVVVEMGWEVECPVPAEFKGRMLEWNIPDPYTRGIRSFRDARDKIKRQVIELLADLLPPDTPAE
jgi:arsenate reductase (thioredoxin)